MKRHLIGAAALLAITAAPAMAADMPLKAPPAVAAVASWTGFYVGVNAGFMWGQVDPYAQNIGPDSFFAPANVSAVTQGAGRNFNPNGGLAGGQVGYLYQSGRMVVGIEASVDWTNFGRTLNVAPTVYPVTPPSTFAWNLRGSSDVLALLTGRVGLDMGPWYWYATGGGAYQRLRYSANFVDTFYPTNNTFSFSTDAFGLALGAGAEWRLSQNWLLRGEYLHVEFRNFGGVGLIACTPGVGNCAAGGNTTRFLFDTKFREDLVRVMLSYKFGGPVVAKF